jgi:hypothetical protein
MVALLGVTSLLSLFAPEMFSRAPAELPGESANQWTVAQVVMQSKKGFDVALGIPLNASFIWLQSEALMQLALHREDPVHCCGVALGPWVTRLPRHWVRASVARAHASLPLIPGMKIPKHPPSAIEEASATAPAKPMVDTLTPFRRAS